MLLLLAGVLWLTIAGANGPSRLLSTALFCLPYEEGLALLQSLEGAEALWVGTDGTVKASPGFPDNLLD